MTTEVLLTPTPSSSGTNGQVLPLICDKGGEQFVAGRNTAPRSRTKNRSAGDSERVAEGDSPKTMRSPRCEAFVMTGEKMLSLNPKISPCYAKMCQNQLPPTVEVESAPRAQQQTPHLADAFRSLRHRRDEKKQQTEDASMVAPVHQQCQSVEELVKEQKESVGDDNQSKDNGRKAIDGPKHQQQQTLVVETDRATIATAETRTGMGWGKDGSTTLDRVPISTSNESKSTSTGQRIIVANNGVEKEGQPEDDETMGGSAIGRSKRKKRNSERRTYFGRTPREDLPMSAHGSDDNLDGLPWINSQQSVVFPAETVSRMARHLFSRRNGFNGTKPSEILVKRDKLSVRIGCEFLALFNFAGLRIDVALRDFLSHVPLCGETFERKQLLEHFAKRYFECNLTVFGSADDVQLLASALLLLSADLHGKVRNSSERAMNCREFIDNLSHLEHNKFDTAMLRELFVAVSERSFNCQPENDETEGSVQSTSFDRKHQRRFSGLLASKRRGSAAISELRSDSFAGAMMDPEQQVDYKHGWLLRKCIYDADGKRTPFGRRKWLMHYVTVRGMVLYLHQDECSFSSVCRYVTFRNCVLLHHALAEPCHEYTKRRNVFRLRTAQLGESLFQTSEPAEVECWCDAINYVAAAFSTPALPTPVGANGLVGFYRPHLPSTATQLAIPDQLRAHEQRMEETVLNLVRLREKAPPMKAKGRVVQEYFYKERFLETEKNRYSVYVSILREKLGRASSENTAIPSNFGELGRKDNPCSSGTNQTDELLEEDGTEATTTTAEADIASVEQQPHPNRSKDFSRHQSQLQRLATNGNI